MTSCTLDLSESPGVLDLTSFDVLCSGGIVKGEVCVDFPWVVLSALFVNSRSLSTSFLKVSFSESLRSLGDSTCNVCMYTVVPLPS